VELLYCFSEWVEYGEVPGKPRSELVLSSKSRSEMSPEPEASPLLRRADALLDSWEGLRARMLAINDRR
jgi:hypothetical protein